VPAARACALSGNAAEALAWLRSIPTRFIPSDLRSDPDLRILHANPDFQSLFDGRQ
jgi:hypothetical protein